MKVALGVEHVADGRQRLWLGQLARVELALVATVVAALVDMAVEFGVDGFDVVAVCAQRFVGGAEISEEGEGAGGRIEGGEGGVGGGEA